MLGCLVHRGHGIRVLVQQLRWETLSLCDLAEDDRRGEVEWSSPLFTCIVPLLAIDTVAECDPLCCWLTMSSCYECWKAPVAHMEELEAVRPSLRTRHPP